MWRDEASPTGIPEAVCLNRNARPGVQGAITRYKDMRTRFETAGMLDVDLYCVSRC